MAPSDVARDSAEPANKRRKLEASTDKIAPTYKYVSVPWRSIGKQDSDIPVGILVIWTLLAADKFFRDPATLVTFLIGPEATKFVAHKEFVAYHSKVLKAAFESGFIEGLTQTYTISDTTARAFRLLMQWFYSDTLKLPQKSMEHNVPPDREALQSEYMSWVEAWILADKLSMPRLQNVLIDAMWKFSRYCGSFNAMHYIYDNTSVDSALRKLSVKQAVDGWSPRLISEFGDSFPREMLKDVLIGLFKERDEYGKRGNRFNAYEFYVVTD